MTSNNDEGKRKHDERMVEEVANWWWSRYRTQLLRGGVDQEELVGHVSKLGVRDGETGESLKVRVLEDVVIPLRLKQFEDQLNEKIVQVEQRNEQLKRRNEQIKKENMEVKKENTEVKKKNEQLKKTSIGQLLKFHEEESEEGQKRLELVDASESSSSHLSPKNTEAISNRADFNVDEVSHKTPDIEDQPSLLLAMAHPLEYFNETEVQVIVGRVLADAVKYVNWASKDILVDTEKCPISLKTRTEASIFSNRPDHMVVYNVAGGPLLPVLSLEVKKPHLNVFNSPKADGQILDYLMMGKLQHGKSGFGILTTFAQSKVVWMQDDGQCGNASKEEGRMQMANLAKVFVKPINVSTMATTDKSTPSPPQHKKCSTPPPSPTSSAGTSSSEPDPVVREIIQSIATYKSHQLFTVLCNAIVASLSSGQKSVETFGENFESKGMLLKGQLVLVLLRTDKSPKAKNSGNGNQDGTPRIKHKWISLDESIRVKKPLRFEERSPPEEFYIIECLGVGRTSRAWRAVTVSTIGDWATCVIKYWVLTHNLETKKRLEEGELEKICSETTRKEVQMYKAIYPELDDFVATLKLGSRWCVILPFFTPVTKEERQKEETKDGIKEVLMKRFYNEETKVSYRFKECDQCWHHIGKRGEEIYIFDLNDLIAEEVDSTIHAKYVDDHMANLERR